MSPKIYGHASTAVSVNAGHVPLGGFRSEIEDPWERLEAARARRAVRSPIQPPEGGWEARPVVEKARPAPKVRKAAQAPRKPSKPPKAKRVVKKSPKPRPEPRKRPGRTPSWDVEQGKRLAAQGLTAREISEQVGATTATVRRVLTRAGVTLVDGRAKFSGGWNHHLSDFDPDRVARLYAELGAVRAVARVLGISHQSVTRILTAHGVTIRASADVQRGRPGCDGAAGLKELMRVNGVTSAQVRAWAASVGVEVGRHGLPPMDVVEDYLAARAHEFRDAS